MEPLERPSLEAYGFGIVAIVAAVVPMTAWLRVLLIVIGMGLLVDITWRSKWTIKLRRHHKIVISSIVVALVAISTWLLLRQPAESKEIAHISKASDVTPIPTATPLPTPALPALRAYRPHEAAKATNTLAQSGVSSQSGTAVGSVTVQPGGVASIGQQGGQTAGTIINPPVNPNAPVITYDRTGVRHEQTGSRSSATAGPAVNLYREIDGLFRSGKWQQLIDLCSMHRADYPEWITLEEFEAYGYLNLNQRDRATGMLREVVERAGGNPQYQYAVSVLKSLESVQPLHVASYGQTGGQTADTIINNAQVTPLGNLKDRTNALGAEIMRDLYNHGWPISFRYPYDNPYPLRKMPKDSDEYDKWSSARSTYFTAMLLPRVRKIREELYEIHLRDRELDQLMYGIDAESGMKNSVQRIMPLNIAEIAERLGFLVDQIK